MPRVSIGLPVYNGENYLRRALDSILNQSFADFELIISDNDSMDGTELICREYTAKDQRIRYFRNAVNLGAAVNFNRVFMLSTGDYFKWAAHDDMCAPDFLLKCVQMLDLDPSIVLSYPKTKIIDKNGDFLQNYDVELNVNSPNPVDRFHDILLHVHSCFPIFGVVRSELLKKTRLIGSYASSDRVLLGELSLYGRFFEIPEYLFYRRNHPQQSTMAYDHRSVTTWFDPSKTGKMVFMFWRILLEHCQATRRAPLSWNERSRCYLVIKDWGVKKWKNLLFDFVVAAKQLRSRAN